VILLFPLAFGVRRREHHRTFGPVMSASSSRPSPGLGERDREVDAYRALADAALAGPDRDDVLDVRRSLGCCGVAAAIAPT